MISGPSIDCLLAEMTWKRASQIILSEGLTTAPSVVTKRKLSKKMLFSSSVLFVEGPTDRVVLGAVFDEIFEMDLSNCEDYEKYKQLQHLLAETNIIEIDSSTKYNMYKQLSNEMAGLKHWFVFDRDMVFVSQPQIQLHVHGMSDSNARAKVFSACLELHDGNSSEWNDVRTLLVEQLEKNRKSLTREESDFIQAEPNARAILEMMYLPKQSDKRKDNRTLMNVFGLEEQDKLSDGELVKKACLKRQIFPWETGNLEDVVVKCLMEDDDGMTLLREIENAAAEKETPRKRLRSEASANESTNQIGRNTLKKGLMEINKETSQKLANRLLDFWEIKQLLNFLLTFKRTPKISVVYTNSAIV